MALGWTDERVETMKTLWTKGLSASEIAKQLGGCTRNAVIGKVHRLGLAGRDTPSRGTVVRRPRRTARPDKTVRNPRANAYRQGGLDAALTVDVDFSTIGSMGSYAMNAGNAMEQGLRNLMDGAKPPLVFTDGTTHERSSSPFTRTVTSLQEAGLEQATVPVSFEQLGYNRNWEVARIGWQNMQVFADSEAPVNVVVSQTATHGVGGNNPSIVTFEAFSTADPGFGNDDDSANEGTVLGGLVYKREAVTGTDGQTLYRITAKRQSSDESDAVADLATFKNELAALQCPPVGADAGAPAIQALTRDGLSYTPIDFEQSPNSDFIPFELINAETAEGDEDGEPSGPAKCDAILGKLRIAQTKARQAAAVQHALHLAERTRPARLPHMRAGDDEPEALDRIFG